MKIQIYRRRDKKWSFRIVAANGQRLAADANQGYSNKDDCIHTALTITGHLIPVEEVNS